MFKRILVIFVDIGIFGVGVGFTTTFPNLNNRIQIYIISENSSGNVLLKLDSICRKIYAFNVLYKKDTKY